MNKKIIIAAALIIVLVFAVYLYWATRPIKLYYPDEPEEWIEKIDEETKEINVDFVSKGQAFDNDRNMDWWVNGTQTSFEYEGYYKGWYFIRDLIDENGDTLMRVGNDMNPNDGIIESMIIERLVNDTYQIFIFVDNDWKEQLVRTNIIWGKDYEKIKIFDFNEISEGIFMDQIEDDPRRFDLNHRVSFSGIIVGDITLEDVKEGIVEGKTFVIFQ